MITLIKIFTKSKTKIDIFFIIFRLVLFIEIAGGELNGEKKEGRKNVLNYVINFSINKFN